ncbi:MAG: antibiotic biosynthesis monooxygenase family protein [Alphaproteobacteria bacterium]|jgi:heme-degrading monooxygenase HmoA|nr:antibiotic biosynthesis monooxygenase family protein [Alphaproteobacteria bacterium]MDP6516151.1 antibiotic biosynthesis monooxygenase family protein [Alphaproteobacteria bacterium]
MMMVIFEFKVREGQVETYFGLAGALRAEVEAVDGFLGIERFESVGEPGKFVSISVWRDAAAIAAWRAQADHRGAQDQGKAQVFEEFRLRVVEVTREILFDAGERRVVNHRAA